jgi:trimeric autotransporter adhesin
MLTEQSGKRRHLYTVMKRRYAYHALAAIALAEIGAGQTKVDLRTQTKSVDFSQADYTRPSKTGTILPATCTPGDTFLKLDGTPGQNLYICDAGSQWRLQGAPTTPSAGVGNRNSVLASDGSAIVWKSLAGDVSGAPDAVTVNRIGGQALSATTPGAGQVLTWSGSSWGPQTPPASPLSTVFGRTGAVTAQTGDYQFSQIGGTVSGSQLPPVGGDLSGALGSATVSHVQNRPVASTAPGTGQVLAWSGTQWAPQTVAAGVTSAFGRTGAIASQTGDYSFNQIAGSVANSQLPALGGDLSGTLSGATVSQIQNRPVAASAPAAGQALTWSGTQWTPSTIAAGVTSAFGRAGAITAQQGDYLASQITNAADLTRSNSYSAGARQRFAGDAASAGLGVAPSVAPSAAQTGDLIVDSADSNQLKVYNGSSWVTLTPIPAHANYAASFSDRTALTVAGATHQLGSSNLIVGCYDNSSPANWIEPSTITVDPASFDVTVRFPVAQSGRCVINGFNGGSGSGGGGSGAVNTVFGRNGDVTPSYGDYAFSQISGTVASSQVAAGLDALKIGAGLVSNQAFGYLANVGSDLQTQLNGKSANAHSHSVGGDVSGTLDGATVAGLQGRAVSNATPLNGQTLTWNGAASEWRPTTGGGGGGAGMASQLGDFATVRASSTALEIGQNCTVASPCNVRFGSRVYSFTSDAQATLTSGAGTAYVYISADGALTVGHTMGVTCSAGCVASSGVTSFPQDSIPLYSWDAAGGTWGGSGVDRRGWISRTTLLAGTGIVLVEAGGKSTIGVDSTVVPTYLHNSASLDFPPIAAGACSADLTFTLAGAVAGNTVAPGWPGGLESGLVGIMRVSADDQIAVRLCAMGRDIDPGSAVFSATITRGF